MTEVITKPIVRLNETFIDLMEKLSDIMLIHREPFRARAYQKAQETIMAYSDNIFSPEQLKGKVAIGPTIMEKLNEYVSTGTLKILEKEKNNPISILSNVYGIGPKKAKELVNIGITTIEQLREKQDKLLNDTQIVGLKYYEDILKRIPRTEINEYSTIFDNNFKNVATKDSHLEIVGSYRRGSQTSGDIDVIITSDSPKVFINFIDSLIKSKIILEVLSRGPTKCLVISKIPNSFTARRIDFLYTTQEEYPFSVLYFTGSKIFNTVMRHEALQKGVTMNEHGLYKMEGKQKGNKVEHKFSNEKDIFDFLGLEYKEPIERVDGRSVIKIKEKSTIDDIVVKSQLIKEYPKTKFTTSTKTLKNKSGSSFVKKDGIKLKKTLIIEEDDADYNPDSTHLNVSKDNSLALELIEQFKKNGITFLNSLNENQLTFILKESNKLYYNEQPIMTDNQYDIVKEYIENKYPSNTAIFEIGSPIERNKITLPYSMGSMDKIKPDTDALINWMKKFNGPYVLSCKLDGVSGLYTTENEQPKLYTRGDGKIGQDVSHMIQFLRLPKTKGIVIRGEFIISKQIFHDKYKTDFANPRNLVAGIVNHKTIDQKINDIHFIGYEVIKPEMKPIEQISYLNTLNIEVVLNITTSTLSNELLSQTLIDWRKNYKYENDGIIVTNDKIYPRKFGNPEHAFAFKMVLSEQIAEAKVVDVIWTPSKDGYLKPRIQIEPIKLGGVKIEFATGFNGAFIQDNKIGVGAIVELIRSGDVIPYIRKIIVPADEPKMPFVSYKWNDTHIDVLLENITGDETVKEKNITGFFRGIGVEGLSNGNISRIIKASYDTVPKILNMSVEDLKNIEGFQLKTATKIHNGIKDKLEKASIVTLMSATNIFGRGFSEKKIELIMDFYPNVLTSNASKSNKINTISQIKGLAVKSAEIFVDKIDDFNHFIEEINITYKLNETNTHKLDVDKSNPLFGKTIVFTGFRDQEIQDKLTIFGAKLGTSVSKNTFLVVTKDKTDKTGKYLDAEHFGVIIMELNEFKYMYLL